MGVFDQLVLLVTGLVALYLLWWFSDHYRRSLDRPRYDLYYIVSFAVLLVAGLLLIAFGYGVLQSPLVVIVAVLLPAGLSLGLVAQFLPRWEKAYLAFALIGLAAVAATRLAGPAPAGPLATAVLVIVHSVAGLLIFGVPLWAVARGEARGGFAWVAVGGALIGLGGIALAFLKAGSQLLFLSQAVVFAILAPLLLLMTLACALGFTGKARTPKLTSR